MSEAHSIMLGQISAEVEDFCPSPKTTTLEAVRLMRLELLRLRLEKLKDQVAELEELTKGIT
jgi:hypothetical protein